MANKEFEAQSKTVKEISRKSHNYITQPPKDAKRKSKQSMVDSAQATHQTKAEQTSFVFSKTVITMLKRIH